MKRIFRILTLVIVLNALLPQPLYSKPNTGRLCKQHACQYTAEYKQIYHTMKASMTKAPITGNASEDFLYEMISHHQAAISMSQNILRYTNDTRIKQLAENIITEQTKGISEMKVLLAQIKDHPTSQNDADYIKIYEAVLKTMLTAMSQTPTSHNVNVMFLEEMIPHHEGAIAMAENILAYTTHPQLKEMATQIITTQKLQLPEIQSLLKTFTEQ